MGFVATRKSGHSMSRSSGCYYCFLYGRFLFQIWTLTDCLAEALSMVAGSDFEMLQVQLTANVTVEH